MPLAHEHEIHHRRRSRNVGVGLVLGAFIVLVFALTMVKVTRQNMEFPAQPGGAMSQPGAASAPATGQGG